MHPFLRNIYQSYRGFSKSPTAKKLFYWLRKLFLAGVFIFLVYQLWQIGWEKVLKSLPTDPVFYLLYIPIFFLLPGSEIFIYRILWKTRFRDIFPVLLVKKVYNSDVVGYSGEVFLFNWANRSLEKQNIDLLRDIKDNNVISSIVSTLVTLIVLLLFFKTNPETFNRWFQKIPNNELWYILLSLAILSFLIYKFRKYLVSLPLNRSLEISSIHFGRHCLGFFLQVYQWHIVLPNVPMYIWFTFIAVQLVMTRLPFLPNVDLIFLSLSIKLTQVMGAPLAAITAIMTINSVMGKALHLSIYSYFQIFSTKKMELETVDPTSQNTSILESLSETMDNK
ncbi:MAG TPA: hypothetical protein VKA08_13295 [Balneolales bacterium]|nr:hypothetical protein [Balneolales bacterium]